MRISEIMRHKGHSVATLPPDTTVRQLVAALKTHNVGAIVVTSRDGAVAGIVSERDVIRHLADDPDLLDRQIDTIMTAEVRTCTPADGIDDLRQLMTEHRIRHVPVLDEDGGLSGIVSI